MTYPTFTLSLPAWLTEAAMPPERSLATVEARMTFVIGLARRNGEEGTGGPFAAAVFDLTTHRLLAPGVNRVTTGRCSSAHAEIVALSIAQQRIGHYDLGGPGQPPYEPCAWAPCPGRAYARWCAAPVAMMRLPSGWMRAPSRLTGWASSSSAASV